MKNEDLKPEFERLLPDWTLSEPIPGRFLVQAKDGEAKFNLTIFAGNNVFVAAGEFPKTVRGYEPQPFADQSRLTMSLPESAAELVEAVRDLFVPKFVTAVTLAKQRCAELDTEHFVRLAILNRMQAAAGGALFGKNEDTYTLTTPGPEYTAGPTATVSVSYTHRVSVRADDIEPGRAESVIQALFV